MPEFLPGSRIATTQTTPGNPPRFVLQYSYSLRLTQITYPSGRKVNYAIMRWMQSDRVASVQNGTRLGNQATPRRTVFGGSIAKMQYWIRMPWIVEVLDARVRDEIEALPADMRARFRRIVELIQGHGLERIREPHVKHLEGRLWEMRMEGKDGISRAIYVTATALRVVVVRVYIKKTRKTPRREIDLALERAKEVNP
jgi:phage-related protein